MNRILALLLALAIGLSGPVIAADITDGSTYSETDASNNTVTNPGFPEGMAPSRVNDAARALQGAIKRTFDRDHGGSWATVGGTGNAITLTYSVAPAAYVQGEKYAFKATAANSGATTVNINALGAKNVFKKSATGVVACVGNEIQNGDLVEIEYDGTQFQILGVFSGGTLASATSMSSAAFNDASASIASAATVNIGAAAGNYLTVTGTTTITAFDTVQAGTERTLEFAGALTLTHNATSLILPGAANIVTAAGDVAIFRSEGSGNWRCIHYTRASRAPGGQILVFANYNGATATLNKGFNISSVTKNGTGDYTFNFTNALPDVNYAVGAISSQSATILSTQAVGSVRIATNNSSGVGTDSIVTIIVTD
jgi:hypothetical protein